MSPTLKCCADSQQGSGVSSSTLRNKKILIELRNSKILQRLCCTHACVSYTYTPSSWGCSSTALPWCVPQQCATGRAGLSLVFSLPVTLLPLLGPAACPELLQWEWAGSLQQGDKYQPGCANSGVTSAA